MSRIELEYINYVNKLIKLAEESSPEKTYSLIGVSLHHDFSEGFPLLTHKKMFTRGVIEELKFFLNQGHKASDLSSKGVKIWDMNASQEFKQATGVERLEGDELGPIYGCQWRNFNNSGVDQLQTIINLLKQGSTSRQLVMSAWNPQVINTFNPSCEQPMVLPPCHTSYQFLLRNNKLHLVMYQRSGDICLGVPFNIASCGFLMALVGEYTGIPLGTLTIHFGDLHIYNSHIEPAKQIKSRRIHNLPKVKIMKKPSASKDSSFDNFVNNCSIDIEDYTCEPLLKFDLTY